MTRYLALDGPDGGGKSTQASRLVDWLRQRGHQVLHLREPGSTPLGEALRALLLDPATGELGPCAEALLFSAARAELIRQVIRPALAAGTVVVCERCYLSTWVYQGVANRGDAVSVTVLREVTSEALGGTWPDRIFVLDLPYEDSRQRMAGTAADRIEARGRDYHERVRSGFQQLAADDPRCVLVDASQSVEQVQDALRTAVKPLIGAES